MWIHLEAKIWISDTILSYHALGAEHAVIFVKIGFTVSHKSALHQAVLRAQRMECHQTWTMRKLTRVIPCVQKGGAIWQTRMEHDPPKGVRILDLYGRPRF